VLTGGFSVSTSVGLRAPGHHLTHTTIHAVGQDRRGVPVDLVRRINADLDLVAAVQTGTYLGESALALRSTFEEVWSIELSESFFKSTMERHGDKAGLHFIHGDSIAVLPKILANIDGSSLFWLDGHWSGGRTSGSDRECPVLDEIEAIDASPHAAGSCVLVDDARLFLGPPPPPHRRSDWPTFMVVLDALRMKYSRFVTVLEDVIIAGPPNLESTVDAYWLDRTVSRSARKPMFGLLKAASPTRFRTSIRSWK